METKAKEHRRKASYQVRCWEPAFPLQPAPLHRPRPHTLPGAWFLAHHTEEGLKETIKAPRVCPFSLETVHDLTERLLPGLSQRLRISGSPGIPAQSLPTEPMVMSRPGIWESWWSSHSPLLASLPDSVPTPGRVLGRR